jgi:hypothetical protein
MMQATAIQEAPPAPPELEHKRAPLEPYSIRVPENLTEAFDQAVNLMSARLGESPEQCRRMVEIAVLQRGIQSVNATEGKR